MPCRFVLANDVLDGMAAAGADGMSFVFTWLRMSSNKILTWARRANYQSKVLWDTPTVYCIAKYQYVMPGAEDRA